MFNIILDELPEDYKEEHKIKTDFKQALKFFKILDADELDEQEKTLLIMECLFFSVPPNDPDLWEFIKYYIAGGEEKGGSSKKVFDFIQDSGRIFSAFKQIYNIDLSTEKMHWWKFLELFKGLPTGTHLQDVIEIRAKEIPVKMNSKDKQKLMKAKQQYALKTKQTLSLNEIFLGR